MKIINSKIFKIIVIIFIVGLILGIISYFIFDTSELKSIVKEYISSFDNINYRNIFIQSIFNNIKNVTIIWTSGILLISIILCPLIIFFKGISISLIIINIIVSFKLKGIFITLVLLIPYILLNVFSFVILSYYSISTSIKLYSIIKNNKSINIKQFYRKYVVILVIFTIVLMLNSIFYTFISSNIIKFMI